LIAGRAFFVDAADGAAGNREFTSGDACTVAEQLAQLHPDKKRVRKRVSSYECIVFLLSSQRPAIAHRQSNGRKAA
jgi:hypothetical protein